MAETRFVQIGRDGQPTEPVGPLPKVAEQPCAQMAALYGRVGFQPPWIGYFAVRDDVVVGMASFTGPPQSAAVEVAYFTFPEFEGQGIASTAAAALVAMAHEADRALTVKAHTLPQPNASTHILEKLGFARAGVVQDPEHGEVWEWRLAPR